MMPLAGKVALVTGGSRGIGRATAERLAGACAAVVINYVSDDRAAAGVVDAIESAGGSAYAVRADIASVTEIDDLFRASIDHFGHLDIFVANAGYAVFAPLLEVTEADFDRIHAVNTRGTFFCLQQAARHLADNGRIVCVSTIGTLLNLPGGAAYFGSKGAVEQYARVLAKELAPRGITVNTVSPGFTDTEMYRATGGDDPSTTAGIIGMTPLGRLGQPDDVAGAICFLAGPDAAWVNRQNFAADGGIISR